MRQSNLRFDLQNIQSRAKHDSRQALTILAVIIAFILKSTVFLLHRFLLYFPTTGGEENKENSACVRK